MLRQLLAAIDLKSAAGIVLLLRVLRGFAKFARGSKDEFPA
jgi:hypothetical protein